MLLTHLMGDQRRATNLRGVVSTSAPHHSPLLRTRFAELGLSEDLRIHPHMVRAEEMVRKVLPRRETCGDAEMSDHVWGGCVAHGAGKWSAVTGTWRVPAIKPGLDDNAGVDGWLLSHWVGLDGSGSKEVLQCGVAQQIKPDGKVLCYPWYEWYVESAPSDAPVYIHAQKIDAFTCEVHDTICGAAEYFTGADGKKRGRLTLANVTNGGHFSIELDPPTDTVTMAGVSAEWVVEDYNGGYAENHSLAFFTPIQFTQCSSDSPTMMGYPGIADVVEVMRTDGKEMTKTGAIKGNGYQAAYYEYIIDP